MARELPKPDSTHAKQPTHEQIAQRAYQIFLERGQPQGRDMEHWLEAETQLMTKEQPARKSAPSSMTPMVRH